MGIAVDDPADDGRAAWAAWAGFLFVAGALAFLEFRDPFYFCQDDALVLELPATLFACRSLWQGILPEYNPCNFLGSPLLSVGGGLLYPPLWAAYAFARHVLGAEVATFDVFAIGHLIAGYWITWFAARRSGAGGILAALCAAGFVLAGPLVVMGRSWHVFATMAVFIPGLHILAQWLWRGGLERRWAIATGIALGLLYHAGFPQLFVIGTGLFMALIVLAAACRVMPWRQVVWLVPALMIAAALALPVYLRQREIAGGMLASDGGGEGVGGLLAAMLLPAPLVIARLPNYWGSLHLDHAGHFAYFGTVLLLLFLGQTVVAAVRGSAAADSAARAGAGAHELRRWWPLAAVAGLAFWMSLGDAGGLWRLMGLLPAGLRNNPFRVLPWFVFYAGLAAVTGPWRPAPRLRVAIAIGGLALLAWHVRNLDVAFYTYAFKPYPALDAEVRAALAPAGGPIHRGLACTAMRSIDPRLPAALPHNLNAAHGVPMFYGYDPVMQSHERFLRCLARLEAEPLATLQAYGVSHLLVHRTLFPGRLPESGNRFESMFPLCDAIAPSGLIDPALRFAGDAAVAGRQHFRSGPNRLTNVKRSTKGKVDPTSDSDALFQIMFRFGLQEPVIEHRR